jgi:hypothetical protein
LFSWPTILRVWGWGPVNTARFPPARRLPAWRGAAPLDRLSSRAGRFLQGRAVQKPKPVAKMSRRCFFQSIRPSISCRARRRTRDLASRTALTRMPSSAATSAGRAPSSTTGQKARQVAGVKSPSRKNRSDGRLVACRRPSPGGGCASRPCASSVAAARGGPDGTQEHAPAFRRKLYGNPAGRGREGRGWGVFAPRLRNPGSGGGAPVPRRYRRWC